MQFPSLGGKGLLEEEMAARSSILAGESRGQWSLMSSSILARGIPWTVEPDGLQQSCPRNPVDSGA